MNKALAAGGVIVAVGVAVLVVKFSATDYPIEVGDGSIKLHYGGSIKKNTDFEVEPDAFLHKVKTITIGDDNGGGPITNTQTYDVRGKSWTITSTSTAGFQIALRSYWLGLEDGVPVTCPTPWTGSGTQYTCSPNGGTRLTPVILTLPGLANCPKPTATGCELDCPSKYCRLQLEYKK